jgi:hypothetical protein
MNNNNNIVQEYENFKQKKMNIKFLFSSHRRKWTVIVHLKIIWKHLIY